MKISNQKLSLRGSLADDIAKQLNSSAHEDVLLNILDCIFGSNPDDLICISEGGIIVIGKKSDQGKFKPDW